MTLFLLRDCSKCCKNFSFFPFFRIALLIQVSQACYWSYSTVNWNHGHRPQNVMGCNFITTSTLPIPSDHHLLWYCVLVKLRHKWKAADLRLTWSKQLWWRLRAEVFDKLGGTISAKDLCPVISGLLCCFLQLEYLLLRSACKTITLFPIKKYPPICD